jgi:uncharacterized coiled-coil protein SlyX
MDNAVEARALATISNYITDCHFNPVHSVEKLLNCNILYSSFPPRPAICSALASQGGEAYGKDLREAPLITDEALTPQSRQQATQAVRRRLAITLAAALVLVGGGWITLWAAGERSPAVAPAAHPLPASGVSRRPSDELLETTKGLQVTQQQAVDQLQVVQDQLVAQRVEMKKLSEQIAVLTERFDALQQSVANIPATTRSAGSSSGPQPKAH